MTVTYLADHRASPPPAQTERSPRGDAARALSFAARIEEAARLIRLAMHEDAPFTGALAVDEILALNAMPDFLDRKAEKAECIAARVEARTMPEGGL